MALMGRTLDLAVVAEGVETAEQLAFLRDIGVDAVQGFLLARPAPADELAKALARPAWLDPA
jgi:EAL domain-containing protein (putative c-di-GMP-specific phosphodiesterase class I)